MEKLPSPTGFTNVHSAVFSEEVLKLSVTGGPAAELMAVASNAESFDVLVSPPPDTVAVFVKVPEALLAPPPPAVRQRSDMRRGVVLMMVGIGLIFFLAAVNDWEGGAWSIGLIPFLIGVGYLLVWKLEGKKEIPPPLPPA